MKQNIRIKHDLTDAEITLTSKHPNRHDAPFFLKFNQKLNDLFKEFEDKELIKVLPCTITIKIK